MTIPSKSKKMRLAHLGVHLQAANLLRHSSTITEWKQAAPTAVHRTDNPCNRESQKCKTCHGRRRSEAARAGCARASRDSRRNDCSRENLSQSRRGDVPVALGDQDVTLDARLNDVQVSESKSVQLLCHVVKQRDRIAIRDSIPSSAGRDAYSDTV